MKMTSAILLTLTLVPAFAAAQTNGASVNDLSWMAGCWERKGTDSLISEQWMRPEGGTMMGMGRTVRSGKTVEWEFLRIVENADGISYIARPHESTGDTAFKRVSSSKTEIVFENLAHDFPQRIIYRKAGMDGLFARVEGTRGGKLRGIGYEMKRTACG